VLQQDVIRLSISTKRAPGTAAISRPRIGHRVLARVRRAWDHDLGELRANVTSPLHQQSRGDLRRS
jgi:hypothetical protein